MYATWDLWIMADATIQSELYEVLAATALLILLVLSLWILVWHIRLLLLFRKLTTEELLGDHASARVRRIAGEDPSGYRKSGFVITLTITALALSAALLILWAMF